MRDYALILRYALEHPWAMMPEMGPVVAEILARHVAGHALSAEEIQAHVGQARHPVGRVQGDVAVLPVFGITVPRGNMLTDVSGATSLEVVGKMVRALAADDATGAIVLDVDSPGGDVAGVTEFAAEVRRARDQKPVIAVANHLMASSAYWAGASATEVVASPSAQTGSIGVFAIHEDMSKALEAEGVTSTVISAGKHKVEGNHFGPLDDEARATIQAKVDESMAQFVADVAKGRGVSASAVRSDYGEGRAVSSSQALAAGMIDRIATLDETIARLAGRTRQRADAGRRSRRAQRAMIGA